MHHISAEEFEAHRIDVEVAALSVEEATQHFRTAQIEVQQAAGVLRNREFVAPHDGVVVAVHKNPGESVTPGEAVFRVVNTDVVRVTGHLDITDAWRVRQGQTVRIIPDIPGAELSVEREVFEGKVVYVSPQLEPETRVCTIAAEVTNRDNLLRSGLQARMEIVPEERPDPASPSPRAPARSVSAGATGSALRGAGNRVNDPRLIPYVTAGEALARPSPSERRAR
jgi:multidrug efflux pump subunit AcrA (membrane-fusion protein)